MSYTMVLEPHITVSVSSVFIWIDFLRLVECLIVLYSDCSCFTACCHELQPLTSTHSYISYVMILGPNIIASAAAAAAFVSIDFQGSLSI